jgi:hypothetical protein
VTAFQRFWRPSNTGITAMGKARPKNAKQGGPLAMASEWNVLTTAWLEVMNLHGDAITVSPLAALKAASDLQCIALANPLDLFSAHRFLLTLLYWKADECDGVEKLRKSLLAGRMPKAILTALAGEADNFALFDAKKPFLQDPSVKNAKVLPPAYLFAEMASGTNVAHFHHGDDDASQLCLRCATQGLLRLAPWTQSGGSGKQPSIHGAPPIMAIAKGSSLCETLGLNLVPVDAPLGKPQWSGHFHPSAKSKRVSLMEALTWNARRVHLLEPQPPSTCSHCGGRSLPTVGPIVFEKNEACKTADEYTEDWRDPAAFHRTKDGKTTKTSNESDAAVGTDMRRLFTQKFGPKVEPAPVALVMAANPTHKGWILVMPCTNPANNKSYDHRLVTLDEWPSESPPRPELWPSDIPLLAGDPRAIHSPKSVAAGSGALAFVRAASQLDPASWAVIANAADGGMHEQAAAFDVFTGIYWALRNRQAGVPSRQASWMTLKLMATVSEKHRAYRVGAAVQPWKSLNTRQPPQKTRNGKVRVYPRRIPTDVRLERELREIIHREVSKSPHASIDWPGLCQFLQNVLP